MPHSIRALDPAEFPDFVRWLARCYGHSVDFFPSVYPHRYRGDPDACHAFYVIEKNGAIVSHVGLFPCELAVHGATVRVAGIGGVATDPAERGQGHMTRLLDHAICAMREQGFHASALGGLRSRYNRFGWERSGPECAIRFTRQSMQQSGIAPVPIREVTSREAEPVVRRFAEQAVVQVLRPRLDQQLGQRGLRFWIGDHGYVITTGEGYEHSTIAELVCTAGQETTMIRAVTDQVGCDEAVWSIPLFDEATISSVLPAAAGWSIQSGWMYRIVNLCGLLNVFLPVLEKRVRSHQRFRVSLGVREHDRVDTAEVECTDAGITITDTGAVEPDVMLSGPEAARLFLGGPDAGWGTCLPVEFLQLLPLPMFVPMIDRV